MNRNRHASLSLLSSGIRRVRLSMQFVRRHITIVVAAIVAIVLLLVALEFEWLRGKTEPASGRAGPLPTATTRPHPELSPEDVVQTVMSALQKNDTPQPDAGIATTFAFASPANRQITGPLPRFIGLVHNPIYEPMLNWQEAEYDRVRIDGGHAQLLVRLIDAHGEPAIYLFDLSRQSGGDCDGCWMTDGVMRIPLDATTQPAPAVPPRDEGGPPQA
jgi:hypothetical protein